MPNYVRNIVKMRGIAELPIFSYEKGGKSFDFNRLIPMPESLNMTEGSETTNAISALVVKLLTQLSWIGITDVRDALSKKLLSRLGKTPFEVDQIAEAGLRYAENIVKHGYPTWYGWCIEHWGTKWNAMYTAIVNEDEISFDTAWDDPAPVIAELAKRYPDRHICHVWADEDVGCNTGYRVYENGTMNEMLYEDGSQEAYENYAYCWDEDMEDGEVLYRAEDGLIHVRWD